MSKFLSFMKKMSKQYSNEVQICKAIFSEVFGFVKNIISSSLVKVIFSIQKMSAKHPKYK